MSDVRKKPAIYWHSEPVRPNETLLLSGGSFAPDALVELSVDGVDWKKAEVLQRSKISLKAVVPAELPFTALKYRVRQGKAASEIRLVNAPSPWWTQGEGGVDAAQAGSWLRIFGNCLALDGKATVLLGGRELEVEEANCYEIKTRVPLDMAAGESELKIKANGAEISFGAVVVTKPKKDERPVIDIMEFNPDPTGEKDSTLAFVQAMERARCLPDGAIVQLPRGNFRIDSILRPMTWMDSQLFVMENSTLRGAGRELTTLWWPDKDTALPCLIELQNNASLEGLTIYAQGKLHAAISCSSGTRIENVAVRASSAYMLELFRDKHSHRCRQLPSYNEFGGPAVEMWGKNNRVLNCDFMSKTGIAVYNGRGSVISGNRFSALSLGSFVASDIVIEKNEFDGGFHGGGLNIALFGSSINQHVYFHNNTVRNVFGGDREALTTDGHGTAFFGKIAAIKESSFMPVRTHAHCENWKHTRKSALATAAFIIDGTGCGQWRFVKEERPDGEIVLDRPWDVLPDEESLVQVGAFNGRHLIVGNKFFDTGVAVQLYPPNAECIVAENEATRTRGFFALAQTFITPDGKHIGQFSASWRNQFLNNRVLEGNNWGYGQRKDKSRVSVESACWLYALEAAEVYNKEGEHVGFEDVSQERLQELLGESKPRENAVPALRFAVVRGFDVKNSGNVIVDGAVSDVLVENSTIRSSSAGIVVTNRFDRDYILSEEGNPFQSPERVLLRGNSFESVAKELSGSALPKALVARTEKKG